MKHSATSLKTWDNCPRLYKAKYVDKIVPYVPNAAAERGVAIHEKLEHAVETGQPPADVWTPDGLIPTLHKAKAVVETAVALTENLTPTGFDSNDAWLRGKIDVLVMGPHKALVIDWKTGKVRPDKIQADMYTGMIHAIQDNMDMEVDFRLVYVDQKQVVPLTRDNGALDRTIKRAVQVENDKDYLPQPGWLCRYCDFTACRYNEKREGR